MTKVKKETRGGKRKGAGRPKGEPTTILSYRVKLSTANKIDSSVKKIIDKINKARRNEARLNSN